MKKSPYLPKVPTLLTRELKEWSNKERIETMKKILNRDNQLPNRFNSRVVLSPNDEPTELLSKAGYKDIKRGWIFKMKGARYHAYVYKHKIYLHKDLISNGKHKATTDHLDEEIKRLESLRVIPVKSTPKGMNSEESKYQQEIALVAERNRQRLNRTKWQKFKRWFRGSFSRYFFYKLDNKR